MSDEPARFRATGKVTWWTTDENGIPNHPPVHLGEITGASFAPEPPERDMTAVDTTPLAVFDVDEENWTGLACGQQEDVRAWARAEGLDPHDIFRLEIHLIDCPLARVHAFARDEHGNKFVNDRGLEPATLPPYDVLIRSMPPHMPSNNSREGGPDAAT